MAFVDLIRQIEGTFSKDAFKRFAAEAEEKLEKIKDFIIKEIVDHEVSKEIDSKITPSKFLQSSTASLFGFIGFNEGRDPVFELVDYLEEKMVVTKSKATLGNRISGSYAKLFLPDRKDLRADPRLMPDFDHNGQSWPEMIENGISGLDKYFQYSGKGRSQEGYQSKNLVRDGEFSGTSYLTAIFAKARAKIRNIK